MKTNKKTAWTRTATGTLINQSARAVVIPVYAEQGDDSSPWSSLKLTGYEVGVHGVRVGEFATEEEAKSAAVARWDELPACVRSMRCWCAGHARGNHPRSACGTHE